MEIRLGTSTSVDSTTRTKKAEGLLYVFASILSIALAWITLDLGQADWRVPFHLPGDGVYYALLSKTLLETGWVHQNPSLSAPFELSLFDFAHFDNLHLLLMKIIGFFRADWGVVLNVYYLLTFPLTAITSLVLFRWLKINAPLALGLSVLYTVQPYHFIRGQGHIMLASYYMIPLLVLVAFWLSEYRSLSPLPPIINTKPRTHPWQSRRLNLSVLICLVASSAGHYYACFGCFFFLIASVRASLRFHQWLNVRHFLLLAAVTLFGFTANLAPNFMYWQNHGTNRQVSAKQPRYSEEFGLKTVQMVLPVEKHRIRALAKITDKYNRTSPLVNENTSSAIGLIATLGFMGLVGLLLYPRDIEANGLSVNSLALMNVGALILATVGGFGTVFAYLISPQIHGYNRISIFVALFGYVAFGIFLNKYANRGRSVVCRSLINLGTASIILAVGYLDQTNQSFVPDYAAEHANFHHNESFGIQIEKTFPQGSKFFMLPLSSFPFDDGKIGYDHFQAYLHTNGMRWSDPAMLNRRPSTWHQTVAAKSIPEMLRDLSIAGFDAIWIDDQLKAGPEASLIQYLESVVGIQPLFDGKSRYVFDVRDHFAKLASEIPTNQFTQEYERVFPETELVYGDAFRMQESSTAGDPHWDTWRWSLRQKAIIYVWNHSNETRERTVSWTIYPLNESEQKVRVRSRLFETRELNLKPSGTVFSQVVSVLPGRHEIKIESATIELPQSGLTDELWFRVATARLQ